MIVRRLKEAPSTLPRTESGARTRRSRRRGRSEFFFGHQGGTTTEGFSTLDHVPKKKPCCRGPWRSRRESRRESRRHRVPVSLSSSSRLMLLSFDLDVQKHLRRLTGGGDSVEPEAVDETGRCRVLEIIGDAPRTQNPISHIIKRVRVSRDPCPRPIIDRRRRRRRSRYPPRSLRRCLPHSLQDQRSLAGTSNAKGAGVTLPHGTMRGSSSRAATRRRSHRPTARRQGGWDALRCPCRPA